MMIVQPSPPVQPGKLETGDGEGVTVLPGAGVAVAPGPVVGEGVSVGSGLTVGVGVAAGGTAADGVGVGCATSPLVLPARATISSTSPSSASSPSAPPSMIRTRHPRGPGPSVSAGAPLARDQPWFR